MHEGLLLQAVRASWLAKENRARIDDVVDFLKNASDSEQYAESPTIRDNEGRVFARQGEVMNPLQYVPFNQTLYFINGDDPAQVAWMKRQTPPTLESKIILVQGSIPEMQKSLDSRVYFDQNGVLCQRLGIDQVPARVSAVPGDRFLKVEFIPAEEGRK
ncbi:conjugal transfer protein TraW [Escherichia coli]|nr:conjugal transfer protein TraW [Escherichia coli]